LKKHIVSFEKKHKEYDPKACKVQVSLSHIKRQCRETNCKQIS